MAVAPNAIENGENMSGYNGWKNYETWNVALWISNDESLYCLAKHSKNYEEFQTGLQEFYGGGETRKPSICYSTPDDVAWNDSGLDINALDEMISELE